MKIISFTVPCYNSQAYMRKCVDSLLVGGDDVEIIIVNDGSKDDTIKIANEYAERYPDIVKVVDKENGGHGSGINEGLKLASGRYFKVVDSDDWLDKDALEQLIAVMKKHIEENADVDLYITNFVYDHAADNTKYVSGYTKKMPQGQMFGWDKVKKFHYSHMLLMHSVVFKLDKVKECGIVLPEHTFYEDNYFVYRPLPFMRNVYYLNVDLYHYYIGRADQSVNRKNLVKRYDQQIRVMLLMTDAYKWSEIKSLPKGLKNYMWHALQAVMMNTLFFTCAESSKERKTALKEMWRHIKKNDRKLYNKLRTRSYATAVNYLPWRIRGFITTVGYNILCKRVKLG